MFIDTHCHIYAEEFDKDRSEVVKRALGCGARYLLLPNIDEKSIAPMLAVCDRWKGVCRPMMGLHPTELPDDPWPLLNRMEQKLMADEHPYVAIGEVGVDLYWDATRREEQKSVFRHQAEWSIKYGLPLVIHSRSAHAELIEVLAPLKNSLPGGIFHCFGGNAEEAEELLTFDNFMLGIGGIVTFKNSTLREVLKSVIPLERIVLETDAPYLAPDPYRGKRNEPSFIPYIIETLSSVYRTTEQEVARVTTRTASQLFCL